MRWIERGITAGGKPSPEDVALLALAHHRLGNDARAQARLGEAREFVGREQFTSRFWAERAPMEVLLAEAAGGPLLDQAPPPRPKVPER